MKPGARVGAGATLVVLCAVALSIEGKPVTVADDAVPRGMVVDALKKLGMEPARLHELLDHSLGEADDAGTPLNSRPQEGDGLHKLKGKAMEKAQRIMALEGERARLLAQNTQHPKAFPVDFDVKDYLEPKDHGLHTKSTSEDFVNEKNNKFLHTERDKMKAMLDVEYKGKKDEAKKERMEDQMQAATEKMEKKNMQKAHDKHTGNHVMRVQRLQRVLEAEKAILNKCAPLPLQLRFGVVFSHAECVPVITM